jgi:hypothetical protein
MVVDLAKIERLEKELEEAKRELAREDGERYRILMREISEEEKELIMDSLTDRRERILFRLDPPEEPKKAGAPRPGSSGGDLVCDICGKSGLTRKGLALHKSRLHKGEAGKEEDEAA